MLSRESLISYAMNFAAFLVDSKAGEKINKIILFGSVAREDFTEESDIDLFIDADKKLEKEIEKIFTLFRSSQTYKTWELKGLKNELSLKVGNLKKWGLRREVISSGIVLYGKHSELPEKAVYYLMITTDLKKKKTAQQMKIWRKLYGYKQKIGKKVYESKGLLEEAGGRKLGKAIILIPMEKRKEILQFLNKNKVTYTVNELWSDTFE